MRPFICLLLGVTLSVPASGWTLKRNKKGIKIYTRPMKGTSFKEYKGITIVSGTVPSIHALLDDTKGAKEWISRLTVSKVLKKISETEAITLTVTDSPWPVKDRETISKSKMVINKKGELYYKSKALPKYLPPRKGRVRIRKMYAIWRAIPMADGKVKVIHQAFIDPSGAVPSWLLNMFVVDMPFDTLVSFKKQLKKSKYSK